MARTKANDKINKKTTKNKKSNDNSTQLSKVEKKKIDKIKANKNYPPLTFISDNNKQNAPSTSKGNLLIFILIHKIICHSFSYVNKIIKIS